MPNELVRQRNEQNVLRQAMQLFVANGIENTSVEMIARASGLTLRSVQNYYHTKNELIAAVLNTGYAVEFEEMQRFFSSEQYRAESGAAQVMDIVSTTLNKALEHADIVFCTSQMQHVISRAPKSGNRLRLTDNWVFIMEQLQDAFGRGILDGSVTQATENELVDVKTTTLALLGVREQVAYAMCDDALRELFDPQTAVEKYIRQMELMLTAGQRGPEA